MIQDTTPDRPTIDYPCPWEYRIIGMDAQRMAQAVMEVLGDEPYTLTPSHESRGGKYISQKVEMVVTDEAMRLRIYESLRQHADIRMVL